VGDGAIFAMLAFLAVVSLAGVTLLVLLKPRAAVATGPGNAAEPAPTVGGKLGSPDEPEAVNAAAQRLIQAGFYRRNSPSFYRMVRLCMAGVPVLLGFIFGVLRWVPLLPALFAGTVTGILATVLPGFWLDARKRGRQTSIRRALPDALDIIVVCVEAGLSVAAAMSRVARELRTAHPLLAMELSIVEREIQLGASSGTAIRRFADRFDLEELRTLASVIQQAERFGSSIAQALRVSAETLRQKRFQAAEEKAQKASVKLLFPTLFFIFPTLFVVLIGPAVFDIYGFLCKFVYKR
jgi:tight adherence protein C